MHVSRSQNAFSSRKHGRGCTGLFAFHPPCRGLIWREFEHRHITSPTRFHGRAPRLAVAKAVVHVQ